MSPLQQLGEPGCPRGLETLEQANAVIIFPPLLRQASHYFAARKTVYKTALKGEGN
jgi:hypothetical protein